jgi:hypothetical protein
MSEAMDQPTQEEIEAYFAQLREAPIGEVLMQCIDVLAATAQAKLGRRDARAAIDGLAALAQIGEPHLGEAAAPLKNAVAQLQMAQVQLERRETGTATAAADTAAEPEDPAPAASDASPKATDKLWLPGR